MLCYTGLLSPYFAYANMGGLMTAGVILAYIVAIWLYIDYGLLWENHVNDEELRKRFKKIMTENSIVI
eukprot:UN28816